jgi:hypothetical protein
LSRKKRNNVVVKLFAATLHQQLLHQASRRERQLKIMIEDNEQIPSVLKSKA